MIEILVVLAYDFEKNIYDKTFSVLQDDQLMFIGTPSLRFSTPKLHVQEICLARPFELPNESLTLSQFIPRQHVIAS